MRSPSHEESPHIKQDKTDRLRRGGKEPVYYHSYLQLDQLLSSTRLLSAPANSDDATLAEQNLQGAHDEHLFIIIHQTYELWFKQILWELDSVVVLFDADCIPEASVGLATGRLHRVSEILRILVDQLTVLETMSPMMFLDFRDHLFPASGFQSLQWRLIENTLGLQRERRCTYGKEGQAYCSFLREEHAAAVEAAEAKPNLLGLVQRWLERTPFLKYKAALSATERRAAAAAAPAPTDAAHAAADSSGPDPEEFLYDFWESYRLAIERTAAADTAFIASRAAEWRHAADAVAASGGAGAEEAGSRDSSSAAAVAAAAWRDAQLKEVAERKAHYDALIDKGTYEEMVAAGRFKFSHRAMQAALLVNLYQDEPILNQAFRFLQKLMDIDELMTQWRHRHALMVHRMLGVKMGTGGSSGFSYLMEASAKHRVFTDLFHLSTYLIPRSELPPLPNSVRAGMAFRHESA